MTGGMFQYDQMIEEALRGVIRRALKTVQKSGLPGNHHFYITFRTTDPGVSMAEHLVTRYPDEMTIVLQLQFWDLEVTAEGFSVTLSFNDVPERLVIPFAAVTAFADPSAKFGLQFQQTTGAIAADDDLDDDAEEDNEPTRLVTPPAASAPKVKTAKVKAAAPPASEPKGDEPAGKVVTLDSFRRR